MVTNSFPNSPPTCTTFSAANAPWEWAQPRTFLKGDLMDRGWWGTNFRAADLTAASHKKLNGQGPVSTLSSHDWSTLDGAKVVVICSWNRLGEGRVIERKSSWRFLGATSMLDFQRVLGHAKMVSRFFLVALRLRHNSSWTSIEHTWTQEYRYLREKTRPAIPTVPTPRSFSKISSCDCNFSKTSRTVCPRSPQMLTPLCHWPPRKIRNTMGNFGGLVVCWHLAKSSHTAASAWCFSSRWWVCSSTGWISP